MLVAETRRIFSGRQIVHSLIGEPSDMRIQHADVDLLALARYVAMAKRGKNPDATIEPSKQVRHRHTNFLR
jgi:hypothetical protein